MSEIELTISGVSYSYLFDLPEYEALDFEKRVDMRNEFIRDEKDRMLRGHSLAIASSHGNYTIHVIHQSKMNDKENFSYDIN